MVCHYVCHHLFHATHSSGSLPFARHGTVVQMFRHENSCALGYSFVSCAVSLLIVGVATSRMSCTVTSRV